MNIFEGDSIIMSEKMAKELEDFSKNGSYNDYLRFAGNALNVMGENKDLTTIDDKDLLFTEVRKARKKYLFKAHPDKNRENKANATRITQSINEIFNKIEQNLSEKTNASLSSPKKEFRRNLNKFFDLVGIRDKFEQDFAVKLKQDVLCNIRTKLSNQLAEGKNNAVLEFLAPDPNNGSSFSKLFNLSMEYEGGFSTENIGKDNRLIRFAMDNEELFVEIFNDTLEFEANQESYEKMFSFLGWFNGQDAIQGKAKFRANFADLLASINSYKAQSGLEGEEVFIKLEDQEGGISRSFKYEILNSEQHYGPKKEAVRFSFYGGPNDNDDNLVTFFDLVADKGVLFDEEKLRKISNSVGIKHSEDILIELDRFFNNERGSKDAFFNKEISVVLTDVCGNLASQISQLNSKIAEVKNKENEIKNGLRSSLGDLVRSYSLFDNAGKEISFGGGDLTLKTSLGRSGLQIKIGDKSFVNKGGEPFIIVTVDSAISHESLLDQKNEMQIALLSAGENVSKFTEKWKLKDGFKGVDPAFNLIAGISSQFKQAVRIKGLCQEIKEKCDDDLSKYCDYIFSCWEVKDGNTQDSVVWESGDESLFDQKGKLFAAKELTKFIMDKMENVLENSPFENEREKLLLSDRMARFENVRGDYEEFLTDIEKIAVEKFDIAKSYIAGCNFLKDFYKNWSKNKDDKKEVNPKKPGVSPKKSDGHNTAEPLKNQNQASQEFVGEIMML